ncbi:hypothetical protein BKA81DRAFT_401479 [Phyllosticta paracitricarpa]
MSQPTIANPPSSNSAKTPKQQSQHLPACSHKQAPNQQPIQEPSNQATKQALTRPPLARPGTKHPNATPAAAPPRVTAAARQRATKNVANTERENESAVWCRRSRSSHPVLQPYSHDHRREARASRRWHGGTSSCVMMGVACCRLPAAVFEVWLWLWV